MGDVVTPVCSVEHDGRLAPLGGDIHASTGLAELCPNGGEDFEGKSPSLLLGLHRSDFASPDQAVDR